MSSWRAGLAGTEGRPHRRACSHRRRSGRALCATGEGRWQSANDEKQRKLAQFDSASAEHADLDISEVEKASKMDLSNFVDIWLKSKEGGRNKNPKVEIRAKGSCNPKARKF